MEIRWLEDAIADVRDIHRHIATDNPPAAARMIERIQRAANALSTFEKRGRPGRWPGTRELVVVGTPYIVPYRVREGVVEILRVFHGAQEWPEQPNEEG